MDVAAKLVALAANPTKHPWARRALRRALLRCARELPPLIGHERVAREGAATGATWPRGADLVRAAKLALGDRFVDAFAADDEEQATIAVLYRAPPRGVPSLESSAMPDARALGLDIVRVDFEARRLFALAEAPDHVARYAAEFGVALAGDAALFLRSKSRTASSRKDSDSWCCARSTEPARCRKPRRRAQRIGRTRVLTTRVSRSRALSSCRRR